MRDLSPDFPDVAYTTLMTTLERLHRKGLLDRDQQGRAYGYRARVTKAETVLSFLVDELGPLDGEVLDALEKLVSERRRQLEEDA